MINAQNRNARLDNLVDSAIGELAFASTAQLINEVVAAARQQRAHLARAYIAHRSLQRHQDGSGTGNGGQCEVRLGLDLGIPLGVTLSADVLMAKAAEYAEQAAREARERQAVQMWLDLISLLGAYTPNCLYVRLQVAMNRNAEGYGGTAAENHLWGDRRKHEVLTECHRLLEPALYLEIGVDKGRSLACARDRALGIDPRPNLMLSVQLTPQTQIITASSDDFFRNQADGLLQPRPELVFIDGMHLFEFALRDFRNVERYSSPTTLVVIDDIFPCHPIQAARNLQSDAWTGDIWKLHQILRTTRPDLTLLALNAHTTGLLLIAGLDPENRVLWHQEPALVTRYRHQPPPPTEVLERHGAIPSDHPLVAHLLATLRQGRDAGWSVAQVRDALAALQPEIAEAEQAYWGQARRLAERAATSPASGA